MRITMTMQPTREDRYSYSEPEKVRVQHLDLDVEVCFDRRTLKGCVLLTLDRVFSGDLVLDCKDLNVESAEGSADGSTFRSVSFDLGGADPLLGSPLKIHLPTPVTGVRIRYSTSSKASGLQWLEPAQTAAKTYPFLFTQSEATHARSWIPLQDSPGVRMTYSAQIRAPRNLLTLMGARRQTGAGDGEHRFLMPQPIPPYLIALAVGDIEFRQLGTRTGVYAERTTIERAARELEDIEQMLGSAEELFGPYRWGRYDVLVLPPSFPIGGMENPCLTFASPTILAGDKSLVSLVIHEMAHSWSSNLVSNATWEDFWLNEGFTVYMERRIVEKVYGRRREEMEATLGLQELKQELARSDLARQALHLEMDGHDPNAGLSQIPYEKGALFLRTLEVTFGRRRFDAFLRGYFDHFAFQSVTTDQFEHYLKTHLLDENPELAARVPVSEWIRRPGLPHGAAWPVSNAFVKVEAQAKRWLGRELTLADVPMTAWSTQERLHFLRSLPEQLGADKMKELEKQFHFTGCGNAELEEQWLEMAIRNGYKEAYSRVGDFLSTVGRRKYLKSLYGELVKTPQGRKWALEIYEKARPTYHPIAQKLVNEILQPSN